MALIGAIALAALYYLIKPLLGEWSIPVTIIISMRLIGKIKNLLWANTVNNLSGFLLLYTKKLKKYIYGLYGCFFGIAALTYQLIKVFGLSYFFLAFAISVFLCLAAEQLYDLVKVYSIQVTKNIVALTIIIALSSSIFCTALVFVLMQKIGFSGKTATICGLIALKLTQPLLVNKMLKAPIKDK